MDRGKLIHTLTRYSFFTWLRYKVNFTVHESNSGVLMFSAFYSAGDKGMGRVVLANICQMCDVAGEDLYLFAQNEYLTDYYRDFGFMLSPPPPGRSPALLWMRRKAKVKQVA